MAIPMVRSDQKAEDIRRHNVSLLGMGSDREGQLDALRNLCEVAYLPRTEGVSSRQLRSALTDWDGHSFL